MVRHYREDYSQTEWHQLILDMGEDVPQLFDDCIDSTGEFHMEYEEILGGEVYEYEGSIEDENIMYNQKTDETLKMLEISCPHCNSSDVTRVSLHKRWQYTKFIKTHFPNHKIDPRSVDISDLKGCNKCHTFFIKSPINKFNNEETDKANSILKDGSTRKKITYFLK
jgi:hypothetical protein